jgi:hypothetical protein
MREPVIIRCMNETKLNTALHTNLLSLADTPAGFSASEVTGYSPEQVRRAAEALVHAGKLVRSAVSPRRIRYFANEQLVQAYATSRPGLTRPQLAGGLRAKASWRGDEPAVITSRTKIYIAPPLPHNVFRTNTYTQF